MARSCAARFRRNGDKEFVALKRLSLVCDRREFEFFFACFGGDRADAAKNRERKISV
ncbi:MAG: hypothetical protein LBI57_07060 [Helicobacteraceae bacterium]|jgi:hypothetical protein|nr:hypothetical protein [Helicobacteraceae bacterium]